MTHTIHEYNHGGVCIFCGYEKKAMAESIQDQKEHKHTYRQGVDNAGEYNVCECGHKVYKDQKADETKNSDGNESKSECCSPIIAHEIDEILYPLFMTADERKKATQQLLALKERWEREVELETLEWAEHNSNDVNYSISDRIAQLGGKEG